jgi:hypothetical protein
MLLVPSRACELQVHAPPRLPYLLTPVPLASTTTFFPRSRHGLRRAFLSTSTALAASRHRSSSSRIRAVAMSARCVDPHPHPHPHTHTPTHPHTHTHVNTQIIKGHYDTTSWPKTEKASYERIAMVCGCACAPHTSQGTHSQPLPGRTLVSKRRRSSS